MYTHTHSTRESELLLFIQELQHTHERRCELCEPQVCSLELHYPEHLHVCSQTKGADVRFFVHEENVDEVRVLWEVKRLVFGERCRTLDLTTQKKKCPELLTRVNTPWTDTHTHYKLPLP